MLCARYNELASKVNVEYIAGGNITTPYTLTYDFNVMNYCFMVYILFEFIVFDSFRIHSKFY